MFTTTERCSVRASYKSLQDAVEAGKYIDADEDITAENFPEEDLRTIECEILLVQFSCDTTSDQAVNEMQQMGLRPATLLELMALGEEHPDLPCEEHPIILALGSSRVHLVDGRRSSPGLRRVRDGRDLVLVSWKGTWPRGTCPQWCQFAAVRN